LEEVENGYISELPRAIEVLVLIVAANGWNGFSEGYPQKIMVDDNALSGSGVAF